LRRRFGINCGSKRSPETPEKSAAGACSGWEKWSEERDAY
jgi:hypothetical protein